MTHPESKIADGWFSVRDAEVVRDESLPAVIGVPQESVHTSESRRRFRRVRVRFARERHEQHRENAEPAFGNTSARKQHLRKAFRASTRERMSAIRVLHCEWLVTSMQKVYRYVYIYISYVYYVSLLYCILYYAIMLYCIMEYVTCNTKMTYIILYVVCYIIFYIISRVCCII